MALNPSLFMSHFHGSLLGSLIKIGTISGCLAFFCIGLGLYYYWEESGIIINNPPWFITIAFVPFMLILRLCYVCLFAFFSSSACHSFSSTAEGLQVQKERKALQNKDVFFGCFLLNII